VLAERAAKAVLLHVRGAQLEDQRAQLVERLLRVDAQLVHLLARGRLVAVHQLAGRLGGQHEAEESLAHRVVQLERQAVPLGEHGQLAALLVEAGVRDRYRGVRRQQLDQLLVLVGEVGRADLLG
jgi:hypothetical protein